jgi:single stranded DNA-binding protein
MRYENSVRLIGNLTANPKVKKVSNGLTVTEVQLAVNRGKTGKTDFLPVTFLGTAGQRAAKLRKGDLVQVAGEIHYEPWVDRATNQHRSRIVIKGSIFSKLYQSLSGGDAEAPSPSGSPQATEEVDPENCPF